MQRPRAAAAWCCCGIFRKDARALSALDLWMLPYDPVLEAESGLNEEHRLVAAADRNNPRRLKRAALGA